MSSIKVLGVIVIVAIIGTIISKIHTRHFIDISKKEQDDGNK